jgi:hypothetical protein
MCLADLYDVEPKRREKLACLESVIRMRDAVREADAINKFMPAAAEPTPARVPCTRSDPVAAGALQGKTA